MDGWRDGCLNPKILAREGLAELPISRRHVDGGWCTAVTGDNSKGEGLAHQISVGLPVLPPVPAHGHPLRSWSFDAHAHDIPCTSHVRHQNQVEVTEAVDCESYASLLPARHPEVPPHTIHIIFYNLIGWRNYGGSTIYLLKGSWGNTAVTIIIIK